MPTPDLKNVKFAVTLTEESDENTVCHLVVKVFAPELGLDRPQVHAWGFRLTDRKLAERLVRAVETGVVMQPVEVRTDINGHTYLCAHSKVFGRRMNACLKQLGF